MSSDGMIYADISEFVTNPIGTGIQRTVREIFKHWPGGLPACYLDKSANSLRVMDHAALAVVLSDDAAKHSSAKAAEAAQIIAQNPGEIVGPEDTILIPELFYDNDRCAFYADRIAKHPERTVALVYDILPWTHPGLFGIKDITPLAPYFRLIFSMAYTAHISAETRGAYLDNSGPRHWKLPVIDLGTDGLNVERQHFHSARKTFVALGSIETRKRQIDILRAFDDLWDFGIPAELVFVGRLMEHTGGFLPRAIDAAKKSPHFKHYERATDEDVAELLSTARATIAASTVEGYGLPAIESLHAGIPVIVSETMPSTRRLPPLGQIRFEPEKPSQIAEAVKRMLIDDEAKKLWGEAATIELPTWRNAALQVHDWVSKIWATNSAVEGLYSMSRDTAPDYYLSTIAT